MVESLLIEAIFYEDVKDDYLGMRLQKIDLILISNALYEHRQYFIRRLSHILPIQDHFYAL